MLANLNQTLDKETLHFEWNYVPIYCSDNLIYGVQFARKFVDAPEKEKPAPDTKNKKAWSVRMRMNLHNNEAGRQVSGFIWTLYPFLASRCLARSVSADTAPGHMRAIKFKSRMKY
jgi:hypothetical protein